MSNDWQAARDARIDMAAIVAAVLARAPRIIVLTLLALAVTYVVLLFTPRLYESTASILVEPRANIYVRATDEPAPTLSGGEAGVVSSQIELVKSRDTLLGVIEETDLHSVPEFNGGDGGFSVGALVTRLLGRSPATTQASDEAVLTTLLGRMSVVQQRDSRVINISVRSRDPDLAARLANAIASAHVRRRAQLSLSDTAEASDWLREEIDRLRVSVAEAEKAVAEFRVANDLFSGTNNTSLLDQQLSTISTQISTAQERKNQALSRAAMIRGLIERGQSIETVPAVQDSAVIQQLTQERARLQGERAQLSATLLPNHPSVQAVAAQIGELDAQLREEARRIAAALEAEAEIEASTEQSLRAELETLKGSASTATRETVTLQGLIREAEAERSLLESYLRRYSEAASRTDTNSALPDVRVVSEAAPSASPAAPQTTLILAAVGVVALVSQVGIVIFSELISGRAIRETGRPVDEDQAVEDATPEEAPIELPVYADDLADHPSQDLYAGSREEPEVGEPVEDDVYPAEPYVPAMVEEVEADEVDVEEVGNEGDESRPDSAQFGAPEDDLAPDIDALADEPDSLGDEEEPSAEFADEPAVAPSLASETVGATTGGAFLEDHARLSSDLALGRCRIVVLAGHRDAAESEMLAEVLADETLRRGVSVALIDAAGAGTSGEMGIADLSTGAASFGDVVHKSADGNFAEVPWGQGTFFDRRSTRPATLVEALSDIYEVVIVMTGKLGMASTLPAFADVADRLVLVSRDEAEAGDIEDLRQELAAAGYGEADLVRTPDSVAA
ncbi:GumC family protein [Devosia nitrariae]|uniref:Polysaccharide chain length determinant N-terminal domain-containing protein n=1 Tax=Devosia nitrariae TaxID=2071872 RepID=A0ABQ5W986_9HYPH|nr:GumC family protein [Devosia nitrariae]GLQ56336.1 hypothetical protein GCM10010862_35950 [Devosia nitrariae]